MTSFVEGYTIADLLVLYLEALSVEYVFGIPGGSIEPLYNALARSERRGSVRAIVARHETGAAFMADGYYAQSRRLGVCCSTTGPGATNLLTGVASAYENQIPMLVITAQTSLRTFGQGAFQESSCTGVNILGIMEHCTRYNTLVSHVAQFERKLVASLMTAFNTPPGPVHLSIPIDVMGALSPVSAPSFNIKRLLDRPTLIDHDAVSACIKSLTEAKKIVFVIGEGAQEAIGSILKVADKLDAMLLTTPHGKGLVSPFHTRFYGVIGFAGHKSATRLLKDPDLDLVLCIGTKMGEWASNGWDNELLLNERLIHIDELESNFAYTPMAREHIRGRIISVFELIERNIPSDFSEANQAPIDLNSPRVFTLDDEAAYTSDAAPILPQRLMRELPRIFPPSTLYIADTGASFAWCIHYLHPVDRRLIGARVNGSILFRACLEFSSMGWAIGCVIGAALANRERPVVCITGDGSMLMSGQEISVAIQEKLSVIFIVLNDASLGMVKHGQRLSGAEEIGTDIPATDFAQMAIAMGAVGYSIRSVQDLLGLDFGAICDRNVPSLLDVHIDREAVPPIASRIKGLQIGMPL